jgi:Phosphate transport (Pho88)
MSSSNKPATSAPQPPAPPAGSAANPLAFNKLFIMGPVMLLARQINGDDPIMVQYIRMAYGIVQCICLAAIIYVYVAVSGISAGSGNPDYHRVVYIPAPKSVGILIATNTIFFELSLTGFCLALCGPKCEKYKVHRNSI